MIDLIAPHIMAAQGRVQLTGGVNPNVDEAFIMLHNEVVGDNDPMKLFEIENPDVRCLITFDHVGALDGFIKNLRELRDSFNAYMVNKELHGEVVKPVGG